MAHSLRYWKELEQPNGQVVRLEIHEKNGSGAAVQIGKVVQNLRLDIQGGADAIDTPIVKTSLTMTFVDAPDLRGGKSGNWQEFYTPDSTKWKVILQAREAGGAFRTIWGGYITPDSYSEQLRYRGSVTIIARDNIGHLQDFPFDMKGNKDGMVTLYEILQSGWAKIESPMILDMWHEESEAMYLRCEDVDAIDTYMNVSAFEDMSYYDAIEKALYAYGLVLRYTERNVVSLMSLRDLPLQGKASRENLRYSEPIFIASAERELAPAVKRIEESAKYEHTGGFAAPMRDGITFTGATSNCAFFSKDIWGEETKVNIPVHPVANTTGEGWGNFSASTLFFNPFTERVTDFAGLKNNASRYIYLACNTDGMNSVYYRKSINAKSFMLKMTFGSFIVERVRGFGINYVWPFDVGVESIEAVISYEQDKKTLYYNGSQFTSELVVLNLDVKNNTIEKKIKFNGDEGDVIFNIYIQNVVINPSWDFTDGGGFYSELRSLEFAALDTDSLCETNNINTNYIESNNVILTRKPEIASALDDVAFPCIIKNGIFVKSGVGYSPASQWAWRDSTPQQMAVYNHLQLLCYHAKPNNVIRGDIANPDFLYMARIYRWGGADHLLVSGSYNFISGRIEGAVLREFAWYDDMWGDVSDTEKPTTEEKSNTTAEVGGSSSTSSTYESRTDVYVGGSGGSGGGGSSTLSGLNDVAIKDLQNGQTLVFDAVDGVWKNKAGGAGGSAVLEADIVAGVSVGFITKAKTLYEGMTFTEFVEMMFSQGVKIVVPTVSMVGVPAQAIEVGTEVTLNVTSSFKDGYFANTDEGITMANCRPGAASFALNGQPVTMPYTFIASSAAVNFLSVSQPYESSLIIPTKGDAELTETIPAGTASAESTFVVGYRAFWGYMTDDEAESIDSAAIRGLEHTDIIINPTQNTINLLNAKYEIPGGQDIIIAVPEGYALGEVKDEDGDFSKAFKTLNDVVVKCAGTATKTYKVYRFDNGTPYSMEILSISIKKA